METSELPFVKKKITSSAAVIPWKWLHNYETVDVSDKSTYPSKWIWHLIRHCKKTEDLELGIEAGRLTLKGIDLTRLLFTGGYLEGKIGFQKGQNGKKDRVNILEKR
jgi:hypothetical protein